MKPGDRVFHKIIGLGTLGHILKAGSTDANPDPKWPTGPNYSRVRVDFDNGHSGLWNLLDVPLFFTKAPQKRKRLLRT